MNARVQHHITGHLSLRPPQAESSAWLARALADASELLGHERDVAAVLATLKAEFATLEAFEREFPSLCFALATGVGKTRLLPRRADASTPRAMRPTSAASRGSTSWCRTMKSRSRKSCPAICASSKRFEQRKECR